MRAAGTCVQPYASSFRRPTDTLTQLEAERNPFTKRQQVMQQIVIAVVVGFLSRLPVPRATQQVAGSFSKQFFFMVFLHYA